VAVSDAKFCPSSEGFFALGWEVRLHFPFSSFEPKEQPGSFSGCQPPKFLVLLLGCHYEVFYRWERKPTITDIIT
jgi:hypothetical protein